MTSGATYASRLWCALELIVYFSVVTEDASRQPPMVRLRYGHHVGLEHFRLVSVSMYITHEFGD